LLALYFCQRLRSVPGEERGMWRTAAFAGMAAGLAFGGKYTVGVVVAAVFITIVTLPLPGKAKAVLILFSSIGLVAGILCGAPAALLQPEKIAAELHSQAAFYQSIRSDQNYWSAALSWSEVGIPLLVAGLGGISWLWVKRATRGIVLCWLAFAGLLLSAIIWPSFQPFRNVLSLVPLLCIGAAIFCEQLRGYLERRRIRFASALVLTLTLFLASSFAVPSALYLHARTAQVDARLQAVDWLQRHVPQGASILGIRELAILPAEWKRIAAKSVVVPWFDAAGLLQQQRFDFVVTGDFDLRHVSDPTGWSAYRERWQNATSAMPVQAEFGQVPTPVVPYLWRTNDERIRILKGTGP